MSKSITWFIVTLLGSLLISVILWMLGLPIFIVFAFLPLMWMRPHKDESTTINESEFLQPQTYRYCPRCGYPLEGWENYCPRCGFKLKNV